MPRRVPLGLIGSQVGQRAGSSLEFKDHREYQPGDDLRRIDWAAMARTDKPHVKLYHEEVNPYLDIVLDGSASMALEETAKGDAAAGLAAALASAARNAGASHQVFLAGEGCRAVAESTGDPATWRSIEFTGKATLDRAFGAMPPRLRNRSIRVLISDLLFIAEPLSILQVMARGAALVVVAQVLARADTQPPHRGNMRLVDSETGEMREVFVDAAAQKRYRAALERHQQNWHTAGRQVGAVMTTLIAEELMEGWDLSTLVEAEVLRAA
jgi:uncharacterized protein (DUF58 family)